MARTLRIALDALTANARTVVMQAEAVGIAVMGVTKASGGMPAVARAMLRGGVSSLGESRIDNARRLRQGGILAPLTMLRLPAPSEAHDIVQAFDASLNTEADTLQALNRAATELGTVHQVTLMLEVGDRREGRDADALVALSELAESLPGLHLSGVGVNFMCVSGVLPDSTKLNALVAVTERIEHRLGRRLDTVSGGNSANLPLLARETPPSRINQLRIGASILLGENPIDGSTLPGLRADTFELEAELVEIQTKDSMPEGTIGLDAFGQLPAFEDRGHRLRGLVNLGRVDIRPDGLTPLNPAVEILTASSDHLVLDLDRTRDLAVGDLLRFRLDYGALLQAMLSPYVDKLLCGRAIQRARPTQVRIAAEPATLAGVDLVQVEAELTKLGLSLCVGGAATPTDIPVHLVSDRGAEPALDDLELGVLCVDAQAGDLSAFAPDTTVLFGLQRASDAEAEDIRARNVYALTMEHIDLLGVRECARRALRRVSQSTEGIALVLHTSVGGGLVADPLEQGLRFRELSLLLERLADTGLLRHITVSGLTADHTPAVAERVVGYVLSALGKKIL
ncbi:MAG: alanine racemase [Pseudomonadota bacterium]